MDLKDKSFLMTGATGGIGSLLAHKLSWAGARLILLGTNRDKINELKAKLGGRHEYITCDLTNANETKKLLEKLKKKQKIDGLINIAGVGIYKNIKHLTERYWDNSNLLHVKIPFLFTQALIPALQNSDLSLVLNLGSGAGVIPMKGRSAYCASKFALRGLTLSLAEEFKDKKPHFCLITLGSTLTSFGGKSVEEKKKLSASGRAYFPVEWVVDKLMKIIKNEKRKIEYVYYPGDYGLGTWKKP